MATASRGDEGGFRITDPRITESSGLALSRAHPHTAWTVNDSGDTARVFAVDTRTGATVGVHSFGAPVWDVEALAVGPDGRMFVGDIGDNTRSRRFVRVFWFDEPALGETRGPWASWEFAYPDGPHNAETLLVDPRTGRLSIVTKDEPGAVYQAPARPSRTGINALVRVASAPDVVTDGVALPDGRVALRGYLRLTLYAARSWERLSDLPLPLQPQGESVTATGDGLSVLVGSEGKGSRVERVLLPGASGPSASAPGPGGTAAPGASGAPTPPAASSPGSPTPSASAPPRVSRSPMPVVRRGPEPLVAAALGLGAVLLGGVVAWLARRRRVGPR